MALDQNIGMVTAYAYAVSKGYTGTEEQFAQELASAGADLSQIQTQIDNFINTIVPAKTAEVTAEGTRQIGLVAAEGTAQKNAVTEEGTTQKNAVISEGTTQKNAVNSAGSTQVNAVNSAGSTQVGNVNTAGSTQVGAVQAKGQEVINSIPSDYTALSDDVDDLKNALERETLWANLFTGYKSGFYSTADGSYNPSRTDYVCTINPIPMTYYDCLYWNLSELSGIIPTVYISGFDSSMNYIQSIQIYPGSYAEPLTPSRLSSVFANVAFVNLSLSGGGNTLSPEALTRLKIYKCNIGSDEFLSLAIKNTSPYLLNFTNIIYNADTHQKQYSLTRIGITEPIKIKEKTRISVASGYKYAVLRFSSAEASSETFVSSTGWITADETVNADEYVLITLAHSDDATLYPSVPVLENLSIRPSLLNSEIEDLTDAYFEAYTDSTLNEVMWSLFVLHYTHSGDGTYGSHEKRNAIIKPIRFPYAIKVETDSAHQFAYQFYSSKNNSSETMTQASNWLRSATIPANQWFCMIVANAPDSVTDESTTEALQFSYDDLAFFVKEIEDGRIDADGKAYNTIGAHIRSIEDSMNPSVSTDYAITADFAKRNLKATALGTLTYMQSFCKYNGYYYSIDGTNISKQDSTFAVVSDVALATGHGNALQLGHNGKAFASGWNDQKVYEVDLATLTITNTYTLPTTGYTTVAVDDVNKLMYIFQRDTSPTTEEYYSFIVYDYANAQIISTKKTTVAFGAMQAVDFVDGRIFVLNGLGTNAVPNGYRIYNTNGDIIAEYVLGSFATQEPEGVCVDRDTHDVLISFGAKVVYKIA